MKKTIWALMCMASFTLMTACGDGKKADKAAENSTEASPEATAEIVFEDTQKGESEGAKAAKWNVYEGTAKVAKAGGKDCIAVLGEHAIIMPKVEGAEKNFLGEKYTLEFDFLFGCDAIYTAKFFANEHPDNFTIFEEEEGYADDDIYQFSMWLPGGFSWGNGDDSEKVVENLLKADGWNHFKAIYDKGSLKYFVNDTLIADLTDMPKADYFAFYCQGQYYYEPEPDMSFEDGPFIANFRITK